MSTPTGASSANLLESFGVPSQIVADDLGGIGPGLSFLHGVKVFSMVILARILSACTGTSDDRDGDAGY